MSAVASTRRPSPLLLLLCLVLAGLVAAQLLLPEKNLPTGSTTANAAASPVTANLRPGFSMRPLDAFSEVIERPLFRPDRRPAPVVVDAAKADGTSRQGYALLGVVIDDDMRMALLRPKGAKRTLRILEGQQIDGWTVEDVRPDRVVMRRGGVSEEVRLRDLPGRKRLKPAQSSKNETDAPSKESEKADAKAPSEGAPEQGK